MEEIARPLDLIECGLWAFYFVLWFLLLTDNFDLFINWLQL